ncbi:H-type lectin domain protein (macronuclear) [Tetrahymena thermophila SB210]|uniref:H-type lectin domain protein n=1 Tax=Tetrahymena thermophila (strain SB210) TaxID=312017 RepID=I7MDC2_TETTS|nr:H-type lectin domain protein [Tetrahymena thermophila SB210]EAR87310.2 H-type lectin domain protein [Tetrahymena thermophila SB210]|eukprot:XP_001007555.2 H-type lectin domain protein [Tetrahymena thermophila SB210]
MSFLLRTFMVLSFVKDVYLSLINILDDNFIQSGNFTISQTNTIVNIQFSSPFNSTPNIITSLNYLDTLNNQFELDFQIFITNQSSTGFQVTLQVSYFSSLKQANYSYIATTASNIYSFNTSNQTILLDNSQDQNYNIYTTKIPYSQQNLLSNSKIKVLVVGFMTGFYVDYLNNILSVSFQISQPTDDPNNFLINLKEDLSADGQLNEVRYNYFEFYYQENNSIMIKTYQDQTYEFISSTSNCLYNNLISTNYANNLSPVCKQGLCCQELSEKYTRVQTIPIPIITMQSNKLNFQIGFSKISSDLNVQNGRLIISDIYFNYYNGSYGMYITYRTWYGSKILGVTSTLIEYYSLSCTTGYFYSFAVQDCVQTCESQTYPEQNSLNTSLLPSCNPCNSSCIQCYGPLSTNCKSCPSSLPFFIVQNNQCQSIQPGTGFICQKSSDISLSYQYNCYSCDSTCLTCSGTLPTNCLSCSQSFPYFITSTNQCLSSPNSDFQCQQNKTTPTYQFNCQTCSPNCQTCFGPLSNNCQSCNPNLPFFNTKTNECLLQAPATGYYCQNINSTSPSYQLNCYPCDPSCFQCSGPLSTNCLSCTTSFPFYNISTNSCLASAPNQGYFCKQSSKSNFSYQQNCSPCYSTCLNCSGSLQNNCISCTSQFPYFNIQTSSCLSNIPSSNFYCIQNLTNPTYQFNCNNCHINCLSCSGPQSNNCLSCPPSLPFFNTKTNECLVQAPASGYYCQSNSNTSLSYQQDCYPCDQSCLQCSGPISTNCLNCNTNYPFYNLSNNSCSVQAPNSGYFCTKSSNINLSYQQNCQPCDSTCLTCSGTLPTNCISCSSSFPYFNTQTNQCLSQTPGFNFNCQKNTNYPTYQFNCNSCNSNCLSCTGPLPNNCLTCPTSLPYFNTSTNECFSQIPNPGYFCQNSSSPQPSYQQNFYPCDVSCQNCEGSLTTDCTTCSQSYPYYNTLTNTCIQQEPSGFTCQQSSSNYPSYQQNCYPCNDINCLICTNVLPNSCIQCQSNTYLYNNSCTLTKPSPAFCDSNNNCQACTIQFCLNCDQGPQTCSLCPPSFYIDSNSNQCRCPYASYLDSSNNNYQCLSCPANCANCVNSTTCQQCASNSSPDPLYPGNCILNCQSGYFFDRQTQSCQQCAPTCLTCFGSKNNCMSCKTGAQTIFNQINNINECACINQKDTLSEHNIHKLIKNVSALNQTITLLLQIVVSNVHKKIVWSVYQMDLNAFNVKVDSYMTINYKLVAFVNKVNFLIMKINVAKIVLINVNCVQIPVHVFNTILIPLLLGTNAILHVVNVQEVIQINAQSVDHQLDHSINKQIVVSASLHLQKLIKRIANLILAQIFYLKQQVQLQIFSILFTFQLCLQTIILSLIIF